jgi:HemY protein
MNRLLYILLISAISIIGFSMYKQKDLGQVSLIFAGFSFETNLVVFIAAILSILFLFLLINQSWLYIKSAYTTIGNKRRLRLQDKARISLTTGFISYAEGRFEQAEKILLQHIKFSDNKFITYLSAARAAQKQNGHERRDEYLRKAIMETPDADIAIALTKAELQLAHEQNEQALATLQQLHKLAPSHAYVLTLLANAYEQLQEWDRLEKLIPALGKHCSLSSETLLSFEIAACQGQLAALVKHRNSKLLIDFWSKTAGHLKLLPQLMEFYARQLILVDAAGEAEKVLRLFLDKNWHDSTITLYSELDVLVDNTQLEMTENWLADHQQNASLLLSLGKMCAAMSLWGKARSYLEASIAIDPMPETYLKLARLLEEHMNEAEVAQEYYRQGLHLLADNTSTGNNSEENMLPVNRDVLSTSPSSSPSLQIVKT